MNQENVSKEKKEMYPGSPMTRTSMVNGMPYPYQVFKIIQHIHPTAFFPQDQLFPNYPMEPVTRAFNILDKMRQLSPKKMDKLVTMVKDSSVTASGTWEIKDFVQAALNLTLDQWEYFLSKVNLEDETEPDDTPEDKIAVIISTVRTMKKEAFEKFKGLLMACPSFRIEADKINLLESLTKVRSMKKEEFESLRGMVKDSSVTITLTGESKKEVEKTWKQLRQLTIEQVDEVLEMVKDSSVT